MFVHTLLVHSKFDWTCQTLNTDSLKGSQYGKHCVLLILKAKLGCRGIIASELFIMQSYSTGVLYPHVDNWGSDFYAHKDWAMKLSCIVAI